MEDGQSNLGWGPLSCVEKPTNDGSKEFDVYTCIYHYRQSIDPKMHTELLTSTNYQDPSV